jgi:hypothetical protein
MKNSNTSTQDEGRDQKGRFLRGVSGNPGGMQPGTKQLSTQIKEHIFTAFNSTGGQKGLVSWINQSGNNRREFYKMVISLLPKEMSLKNEGDGMRPIIIIRPESTKAAT